MIHFAKQSHPAVDGVTELPPAEYGVDAVDSRNAATPPAPPPAPPLRSVIALASIEVHDFLSGDRADRLQSLLPGSVWLESAGLSQEDWTNCLATVKPDILVTGWQTPALPPEIVGLRYVCHLTGSVRQVVPRPLIAGGLAVTNWGNICAPLVAEHTLLMILGSLRSVQRWSQAMNGQFTHAQKNAIEMRSLRGRRVRIHGFGQIARELIQLLRPFTADIRAYSAGVPADVMTALGVRPATSLGELASDADVFVTCEALTDMTAGTIDRNILSILPWGSVFVNVGRGALVDESALADVAMNHGLRIASDVFVQEPLPADSPLRAVPDALFSPHVAGQTETLYQQCGDLALANVKRFLAGQPLQNLVTLEAYDRST